MLLARFTDRHSQPLLEFHSIAFFTVDGMKTAEVVAQVARGRTAKLFYPGFEPAVISVDILRVPSTVDADACRQVDSVMFGAQVNRYTLTLIGHQLPQRGSDSFQLQHSHFCLLH